MELDIKRLLAAVSYFGNIMVDLELSFNDIRLGSATLEAPVLTDYSVFTRLVSVMKNLTWSVTSSTHPFFLFIRS